MCSSEESYVLYLSLDVYFLSEVNCSLVTFFLKHFLYARLHMEAYICEKCIYSSVELSLIQADGGHKS